MMTVKVFKSAHRLGRWLLEMVVGVGAAYLAYLAVKLMFAIFVSPGV